ASVPRLGDSHLIDRPFRRTRTSTVRWASVVRPARTWECLHEVQLVQQRRSGTRQMSTAGAMVRLAVSNLAIPASAVLTGPILARSLGPAGRGTLAAVLTPIALSTYVLNFGVPEALTYVVAKGRATTATANRLALVLGAIIGALCAGGLIALTPVLLQKYPHQQTLFIVLSLLLPLEIAVG